MTCQSLRKLDIEPTELYFNHNESHGLMCRQDSYIFLMLLDQRFKIFNQINNITMYFIIFLLNIFHPYRYFPELC